MTSPASPDSAPATAPPLRSLQPFVSVLRVSSVLSDNSRYWGKHHLFDQNPDTCWNSAQGSPQSITLAFSSPVSLHRLSLQFQGGFVGRPCEVDLHGVGTCRWEGYDVWDVADDNSVQTFECVRPFGKGEEEGVEVGGRTMCRGVVGCRLRFPGSSDPFGRVTVYRLEVMGWAMEG